ncbi:serologically defined colon cancer antigen 8 homolog isoform X2 [Lingula anatina]|uniref:Serologically defined colon cancer antigen 8 homolog isoform X2 n=1 Tax=Lingula anatina TaxID=7574 RepID=A0A1S3KC34_LINAN|nr:serologically defined colon cancer antigen 8 homolog isoform X2 [Lingula anatina]|eukprot:XP_013420193.1 serologically defined colon cancer antigen 8 homolog isoform X2 [Lingula anatina]
MQAFEDVDFDESFGEYQHSLKERIHVSMEEVRQALESPAPPSSRSASPSSPRMRSSPRYSAKKKTGLDPRTRSSSSRSPRGHDSQESHEYPQRRPGSRNSSENAERITGRHYHQQQPRHRPRQGGHQLKGRKPTSGSSRISGPKQPFNDLSYKAAVDRLRDMLQQYDSTHSPLTRPKTVHFEPSQISHQFIPSPVYKKSDLPRVEEVVPIVQHQSNYIKQLEAESQFCKGEITALKKRIAEVVEENKMLQEELKSVMSQNILADSDQEFKGSRSRQDDEDRMSRLDYKRWKKELERISDLHSAKSRRLEAQLANAREEAEQNEKVVEELQGKLRLLESLNKLGRADTEQEPGLCIQCAQNEAMVSSVIGGRNTQVIENLTKERDGLIETVASFKSKLEDQKQREEEAYAQLKKSAELVEQAQFDKMQAITQREQLADKLHKFERRMEDLVHSHQKNVDAERELARKESKKEIEELNLRLKELTDLHGTVQHQLDRVTREKVTMQAELERTRTQVTEFDTDYTKATEELKSQLAQANIERNAAVKEMNRIRTEVDKTNRDNEMEKSRLKENLEDVRRRLMQAERELMNAKEECITLATDMQAIEKDAQLCKMAKESMEKGRREELHTVTKRAQQREVELNSLIEEIEARHALTNAETEDMLQQQNGLIGKLREECRTLASQLEQTAQKYRGEVRQVKNLNEELSVRLEKTLNRLKEMEAQHVQHGQMHDKMRQRLAQMDEHAQYQGQQILDLLAKQSSLMRDRQLLGKEVEFLRAQVAPPNECDLDKLVTSRRGMVDDVLESARRDGDQGQEKQ